MGPLQSVARAARVDNSAARLDGLQRTPVPRRARCRCRHCGLAQPPQGSPVECCPGMAGGRADRPRRRARPTRCAVRVLLLGTRHPQIGGGRDPPFSIFSTVPLRCHPPADHAPPPAPPGARPPRAPWGAAARAPPTAAATAARGWVGPSPPPARATGQPRRAAAAAPRSGGAHGGATKGAAPRAGGGGGGGATAGRPPASGTATATGGGAAPPRRVRGWPHT